MFGSHLKHCEDRRNAPGEEWDILEGPYCSLFHFLFSLLNALAHVYMKASV